jgi:hypothetical protein
LLGVPDGKKKEALVRKRLIVVAALLFGFVPAFALAASDAGKTLEAHMTGKSEVPKGAPSGTGEAKITVTGTKVCWKLEVKGIGAPLAAHIHKGGARKAGPVVVPLGAKYKGSGCIATTSAIAKAILAKPAGYYVNVHTKKFPNGAVRGQLKVSDES